MELVIDFEAEAKAADEVVTSLEMTQAPKEFVARAKRRAARLHHDAELQHQPVPKDESVEPPTVL